MSESSTGNQTTFQSPNKLTRLLKSFDCMQKSKKKDTDINDILMLWFKLF